MAIAGFQKIGVIGAGQMGNGIAQVCASFGLDVSLFDINSAQLEKAKASINKSLDKLESKDRLPDSAKAIQSRLNYTNSLESLKDADLVIEAIIENEDIKAKVFKELDELCKAEAELERLYATVCELVAPVTLLTLRTTSQNYQVDRPWWKAVFLGSGSVGRNFFRKLAWVAVVLVALIFLREYFKLATDLDFGEKFLQFVDPFLYGALGALVYLYIVFC